MLKTRLSGDQSRELMVWRRDPSLKPVERDRVEMIALSASGFSVAEIASQLGYSIETMRRLFRR